MAGRIVLVIDADLPAVVRQACADVAGRLADQTQMPVTVAASPVSRLDALEDSLRRDAATHRRELAPALRAGAARMTSAPFLWRPDGRPDWGGMWTTFCELALYGGPPQRGPENPLRGPAGGTTSSDAEMLAEMRRGIRETTGLYAEPAAAGWLSVTCESPTMAAWMCAAIILENVAARLDDDRPCSRRDRTSASRTRSRASSRSSPRRITTGKRTSPTPGAWRRTSSEAERN